MKKRFARKLSLEECAADEEQWLLPHHPVISPHKLLPRVVFDSAAQHDGICLNDSLKVGPSLHNDLPGILLCFHERPVALVGEVADMFCQVRLQPEDCKYHRYLWQDMESTRPPDVYEMNCLVFGDKSSPCEANFTVLHAIEDNKEQWPEAAAAVRRDIFVDDFFTSCASVEKAVILRKDVSALMAQGGFPTRKLLPSSAQVLLLVPEAEQAVSTDSLELEELQSDRALGIGWDAQSDTLGLTLVHLDRPPAASTKWGILCRLAGDLGFSLDWDAPLPLDMAAEWAQWEDEIAALKTFAIPRYIYRIPCEILTKELVVFCDASEEACAAAA